MLSFSNEIDPLIFRCTHVYFPTSTQSTTQVTKRGWGGGEFGPHFLGFSLFSLSLLFFFFFFVFVSFLSSFFLLPPLSLFTSFFHLDFLLPYTISSLKKHFPKLLNIPSLITLNIFSDPCVLGHFCFIPIL